MAYAVVSALNDPDVLDDVVFDVVGCGPGSTPAGDDVLVGILAVLTSPHSGATGSAAVQSLRRSLRPLLPTTTDISGHLLRQAADGLVGRAVHELVCALIGNAGTRGTERGGPPSRRHRRDVRCGHVHGSARIRAFVSSDPR